MPESARQAVFLSYASQDAEAARRLCESLRAAGLEVWFDQNELVGGDAWDAKIRGQISRCALFIPIISAATQTRGEGYFRLEWKLAVDRSHLMAHDQPFLLPVVIDATPEASARVPAEFRAVQWTRLPEGATPAALVERVATLLARVAATVATPSPAPPTLPPHSARPEPANFELPRRTPPHRRTGLLVTVTIVSAAAAAILWVALPRTRPPASGAGAAAHSTPPGSAQKPANPTPGATATATAATPSPALDPRRIAVLPLDNFSADTKDEYLADGLTEELNSCLSRIGRLEVIARTSSARAKKSGKGVPEIGAELRAGTLLEGSVRKAGDQLRITVKLIDVASQRQLWSQDYNTIFNQDVFKMQSDIAERVAAALQIKLLGSEVQRLRKEPTANMAAYQLYLQGLVLQLKFTEESTLQARECFRQAVALDPKFALAYCGIAATADPKAAPRDVRLEVEQAARQALALDDTLAEAHLTIAQVKLRQDWDWAAAEAACKRALELQPSLPYAHEAYSWFLVCMGRFDEAIAAAKAAANLDPASTLWIKALSGIYGFARRYEECAETARLVLQVEPDDPFSLGWVGWGYALQGKLAEATTAFQKMGAVERNPFVIWSLGCCDALAGRPEGARRALAELEEMARTRYITPKYPAALHALLGDRNRALTLLEQCYEARDPVCTQLLVDPLWDPLRAEPRFQALIARLNFPR